MNCFLLNSIVVLVPSLFSCPLCGVVPIGHIAKGAYKDNYAENYRYKHLHSSTYS